MLVRALFSFATLPSRRHYRLLVFELSKTICVGVGLHEDLGELLLLVGGFVLSLSVIEKHVHLRYQQRLGIFEL